MSTRNGIGGHQSANVKTDEYITPKEIVQALGIFDIDPCSPVLRPWDTAKLHYTVNDNGLKQVWKGRTWLNPPYSTIKAWLCKMSLHKDGILLVFNRSDRDDHHRYVYPHADSMFIRYGRITFCDITGKPYAANGGAPNIFFAFGEQNSDALADSGFKGEHVPLNTFPLIIVGISPSWYDVVTIAVKNCGMDYNLTPVYEYIERFAPDKVAKNRHWKEKIRQQVQKLRRKNYKPAI